MNRIGGAMLLFCIVIGCANPEEKARTLFNQAQALEREGKGDEARRLMEQVVKQYPQTTAATEANKFFSVQSIFLNESSPDASKRRVGTRQYEHPWKGTITLSLTEERVRYVEATW